MFLTATRRGATRQSMSMAQECPCRPYGAGRTVPESPEGSRTRKNRFRDSEWIYLRYFAGGIPHLLPNPHLEPKNGELKKVNTIFQI